MYEHQVRNTWQFLFVDVKKKEEEEEKNMQSKFRLIKMIKQYIIISLYMTFTHPYSLSLSLFLPFFPLSLSLSLDNSWKIFPCLLSDFVSI